MLNLAGRLVSTNGADDIGGNDIDGSFGTLRPGFRPDRQYPRVGLGANGQWINNGRSHRTTPLVALARSTYFMPTNLWVPYVGAQALWEWSEQWIRTDCLRVDGLMYGPLAGVRFELNPSNDFIVEYQYRLLGRRARRRSGGQLSVVLIGIAHKFKVGSKPAVPEPNTLESADPSQLVTGKGPSRV